MMYEERYPRPKHDIKTDILIIGAGITGLLIAYLFSENDYRVSVAEKNTIASGYTKYITGIVNPTDNIHISKDTDILNIYKNNLKSLQILNNITHRIANCGYTQIQSLFFTDKKNKSDELLKLYGLCSCEDETVQLLDNPDNFKDLSFQINYGIYSDEGGKANCFKLCNSLADCISLNGGDIWERTEIYNVSSNKYNSEALTDEGNKITAKIIIDCTGNFENSISCKKTSYITASTKLNDNTLSKDLECNIKDNYQYPFSVCVYNNNIEASLRILSVITFLNAYKTYNVRRIESILNIIFHSSQKLKLDNYNIFSVNEPNAGLPCIISDNNNYFIVCNTNEGTLLNSVIIYNDLKNLINNNYKTVFKIMNT